MINTPRLVQFEWRSHQTLLLENDENGKVVIFQREAL